MKILQSIALPILIAAALMIVQSCRQTQESITIVEKEDKNKEFLKVDKKSPELFHVLLTSDKYTVVQMNFEDVVERAPDPGGDQYMCEEMKKFNIIDEVTEAVVKVWLYPDLPGRIMKIRPQIPSYLLEINELLIDDVQRWNFKFLKKYVAPTQFTIRYRLVLKKNKSDKEILKDIKDLMRKEK